MYDTLSEPPLNETIQVRLLQGSGVLRTSARRHQQCADYLCLGLVGQCTLWKWASGRLVW